MINELPGPKSEVIHVKSVGAKVSCAEEAERGTDGRLSMKHVHEVDDSAVVNSRRARFTGELVRAADADLAALKRYLAVACNAGTRVERVRAPRAKRQASPFSYRKRPVLNSGICKAQAQPAARYVHGAGVLESNAIQVRSAIRVLEDGEVLSSSYHRHVLQPGDDLSNEDPKVVAIANAAWA